MAIGTYSEFSNICTKFYDLVIDPKQVAEFVFSKISSYDPKRCLFVGGFFLVAQELQRYGLELVIVDYTEEMVRDHNTKIVRDSSTTLTSSAPYVVNWTAHYEVEVKGAKESYHDQMLHRAFSRGEMKQLFEDHGFIVCSQGDNFDETSFYTIAQRGD